MAAIHRRPRRQLRRAYLLALRVTRRHYFSLLSAAILAGALGLALTSSSLEVSNNSAARPASAAFTPRATVTPVVPVKAAPAPELHLMIYYLVDSEAARDEVVMAHQSDITYRAQRGLPPMSPVFREILVVRSPEEEAAAMVFLNDLWQLAQIEGFALHFVDLR